MDEQKSTDQPKALQADLYEKGIAIGAMLLLTAVLIAIVRGHAQWHLIAPLLWAHLLLLTIALMVTPVMLLRRRGDSLHRRLGWIWAIAMFFAALISFGIRSSNDGSFSVIHILSVIVVVAVPLTVLAARRHAIARHRRGIRALVTGGLLTAGFFTFPFERLLGQWLFG